MMNGFHKVKGLIALIGVGWGIAACVSVPEHISQLPSNAVDQKKAELGKRLFYDKRLSGDIGHSCASCHIPEKGFADGKPLADAYTGALGFRNTPSLINTAHRKNWFHDGRIGTNLNDVTRESLTEDWMMNMDMRLMQERVKQDPVYVQMFKEAGFGEPSNGSIRKAIPEFLRTLTSKGSLFDSGAMSDSAKRGESLFKGKAGCILCHSGPIFSDGRAHNTGVPENEDLWGHPVRHATFVAYAMFMGVENYMNVRSDPGAHIHSHKFDKSDWGTFITPSLRELKYTAPYMHNGTMETLEQVVDFYNQGGGNADNKSPMLKPLNLSVEEKADLVAFLEALSGDPLTSEKYVWKERIPSNYPAIDNWRQVKN